MLKTHLTYLKKAVRISVNAKNSEIIIPILEKMPGSKNNVYCLIKDITADARFYSVTDIEDDFWKLYGTCAIMQFVDSLPVNIWEDEERLGILKEDFLNEWLSSNILPISLKERMEKEKMVRRILFPGNGIGRGMFSTFGDFEGEISDCSEKEDVDLGSLPDSLQPLLSLEMNNKERGKEGEPGAGRGAGEEHNTDFNFLQRLDPDLLRLAKMIGRSGGEIIKTGKYRPASKSDIDGITTGADLNSVIPSELALLSSKKTENIFLKKFTSKQLQLFSSASSSTEKGKEKRGPIYVCVDTSGSMYGEPETMAKTLAMAISIIAQREKRPVILINYSDKISFFVLLNLKRQRKNLISFLSQSYGGGNNEDLLFNFLFKLLPSNPRYKKIENLFKGADLLIVSDFIWCPLQGETMKLIGKAREEGLKIYSLGVDFFDLNEHYVAPEEDPEMQNGFGFFSHSDYRFVYNNGFVHEQ